MRWVRAGRSDGTSEKSSAVAPPAGVPLILGFSDLEEIGRGAVARVYRATDQSMNRSVAIKVFDFDLGDEELWRRFSSECQASGTFVGAPHIVAALQQTKAVDGRPCLVMEYCPAGSLAKAVSPRGTLPLEEVLSIGVDLSAALDMVHRSGFLHGDIKPANVLLTQHRGPALSDFGLAVVNEIRAAVMGYTAEFAAPEVVQGSALSAASDVYSLGATLRALLVGEPPFVARTGEEPLHFKRRLVNDAPPPLPDPPVPAPVRECMDGAMAKSPADRFPGAASFGLALQEAQRALGFPVTPADFKSEGEETRTPLDAPTVDRGWVPRSTPSPSPEPRTPPSHQRIILAAAVTLGCLAVGIVALLVFRSVTGGSEGTGPKPVDPAAPQTTATTIDPGLAPGGVTASVISPREVSVQWQPPARGKPPFVVLIDPPGPSGETVPAAPSTTVVTVDGLDTEKVGYCVVVVAVHATDRGPLSAPSERKCTRPTSS